MFAQKKSDHRTGKMSAAVCAAVALIMVLTSPIGKAQGTKAQATTTAPLSSQQAEEMRAKPDAKGSGSLAGQTTSAVQQAQPQSVSHDQAVYLVRSALLTLNDANRSGNYTVVRDLAAPDFQANNTAADLAQSFSDLRRRHFDLFAAALLAPQFTPDPPLDAKGTLRLTGFFATRPLEISFDLTFQSVGGQWRLLAVSVATPEAPRQQSQLEHPPRLHTAKPFYGVRPLSGIVGWRW